MDLFKQMLSIPPQKPLKATQRFTFWSTLLAYVFGGVSIILAPDLWNIIFGFDLQGVRSRGYFSLVGGGLTIIGFCILVLSRDISSQAPGQILGTVFSRIFVVNLKLLSLYNQGLVTLSFALVFSPLDSGLALITYAIWSHETEGSSLKRFFTEIWTVLNPFSGKQRKLVYVVLHWIGYFQFVFGLTVAPSLLMSSGIVPTETLGAHEKGLLQVFISMLSLHAYFQILGCGASNYSFVICALFYRVVWNIPFFLFLGFTSKIGIGLAAVLVSFDVVYCGIILILFLIDKTSVKKN